MIQLSRLGTLTVVAGGCFSLPFLHAAALERFPLLSSSDMLLSHSAQGYLGVVINDVDTERAQTLKLKDTQGAEVIKIDQDAPACKAGLKVHDVVVQMNGQRIEGVEQLRRMLRETPPGRTVSLVIMRDGQSSSINVQLADRAAIANHPIEEPPPMPEPPTNAQVEPWVMPAPGDRHLPGHSSFLGSFIKDRYYTGVEIQPLTTQMAAFFGVRDGSGVLVGSVFSNSPASAAGLKAADVILKVNSQPIVSLSDWQRAIRGNRGKQVQITLMRDKKEQTLTMIAGETKTSSELEAPDSDLPDAKDLVASLQVDLAQIDVAALRRQIDEALQNLDTKSLLDQAEEATRSVDGDEIEKALKDSQRQIERQMQQWKESSLFQQMD